MLVKDTEQGHSWPGAVTVTVVSVTLTVDITVVVPHEVTVDARHCEALVERVSPPLAVLVLLVDVRESDVGEEVLPEFVGELVAEVACGTPHSSRLWPCILIIRKRNT